MERRKETNAFRTHRTIRFHEVDGAGIAFFAHYFTMAHEAFEALLAASHISWESWYSSSSIAAPLRHAEADYFGPLRGGHTYELELVITQITEHSIALSCEFYDGEHLVATVRTVHVCIDKASGKKHAWPPQLVHHLRPHLRPETLDKP